MKWFVTWRAGEQGTWARLRSRHQHTRIDWQNWLEGERITRGVLVKLNAVSITLNPSRVAGHLCCQVGVCGHRTENDVQLIRIVVAI